MIEIKTRSRLDVDEVGDMDPEALRDGKQRVERRVPSTPLDFGKVPEGEPDSVRRVGLCPIETPSSALNPSCNATTKCLGAHPPNKT